MGYICLRIELLGEKAHKKEATSPTRVNLQSGLWNFTSMGHTTKNILTWKNDFKKQATSLTRVHCKVASKAS
jgi:hypothetical protein